MVYGGTVLKRLPATLSFSADIKLRFYSSIDIPNFANDSLACEQPVACLLDVISLIVIYIVSDLVHTGSGCKIRRFSRLFLSMSLRRIYTFFTRSYSSKSVNAHVVHGS